MIYFLSKSSLLKLIHYLLTGFTNPGGVEYATTGITNIVVAFTAPCPLPVPKRINDYLRLTMITSIDGRFK